MYLGLIMVNYRLFKFKRHGYAVGISYINTGLPGSFEYFAELFYLFFILCIEIPIFWGIATVDLVGFHITVIQLQGLCSRTGRQFSTFFSKIRADLLFNNYTTSKLIECQKK